MAFSVAGVDGGGPSRPIGALLGKVSGLGGGLWVLPPLSPIPDSATTPGASESCLSRSRGTTTGTLPLCQWLSPLTISQEDLCVRRPNNMTEQGRILGLTVISIL